MSYLPAFLIGFCMQAIVELVFPDWSHRRRMAVGVTLTILIIITANIATPRNS